jgi:hypothetical protein
LDLDETLIHCSSSENIKWSDYIKLENIIDNRRIKVEI